jgi:hypothetical protein
MPAHRPLHVRDCQGTLWAFYRHYKGQAWASFEGDLSSLKLDELPGSTTQETCALKRQTISPTMDFIVVPITDSTIDMLKLRLSARGTLGRNGSVIHTQIAVGDDLLLSACDNFHDDATGASLSVPEHFLLEIKNLGLLRAYGAA